MGIFEIEVTEGATVADDEGRDLGGVEHGVLDFHDSESVELKGAKATVRCLWTCCRRTGRLETGLCAKGQWTGSFRAQPAEPENPHERGEQAKV